MRRADRSFRGVQPRFCDLETLTMWLPRPELGCCVTDRKTHLLGIFSPFKFLPSNIGLGFRSSGICSCVFDWVVHDGY